MLRRVPLVCFIHASKAMRHRKIAENMEAMMPRVRVTAKPRTGPVPNWYRMAATMIVVRLESTMERLALSKPALMALGCLLYTSRCV